MVNLEGLNAAGMALPASWFKRINKAEREALAERVARLNRGDCSTDILNDYLHEIGHPRLEVSNPQAHCDGLTGHQARTFFALSENLRCMVELYGRGRLAVASVCVDDAYPTAQERFDIFHRAIARRYPCAICVPEFEGSNCVIYHFLLALKPSYSEGFSHGAFWREFAVRYSVALSGVDFCPDTPKLRDRFEELYFRARRLASDEGVGFFGGKRAPNFVRYFGSAYLIDRRDVISRGDGVYFQRQHEAFRRLTAACFDVDASRSVMTKVHGWNWQMAKDRFIRTIVPFDE